MHNHSTDSNLPTQSTHKSMRIQGQLFNTVKLFTRPNCGLCAEAKHQIEKAATSKQFAYNEIDITKPEHSKWFDKYAFDVPVVHVQSSPKNEPFKVFMHRLKSEDLEEALGQKT